MKKIVVSLLAAVVLCGCQSVLFDNLPQSGNDRPIIPVQLKGGANTVILTDYLPEWDGADSVTSSTLAVKALAEDWSEFELTAPAEPFATTCEVWQDGACLSVVAYGGERNNESKLFSTGYMLHLVVLEATQPVNDIVAMWQNCRLPEESIIRNGNSFEILIPEDAKTEERSFLRVFAVGEKCRFNDLLIPLEHGNVVNNVTQLSRRDREAQVLYSFMIDRFNDGRKDHNQQLK